MPPEELAVLLDIRARLDAVGLEAEAHGEIAGEVAASGEPMWWTA